MPVHRHLHDRLGSVYASKAELDAWAQTRNLPARQENVTARDSALSVSAPAPSTAPATSINWGITLASLAFILVLAIGSVLWLQHTDYFWRNPIANARFQTITDFDGLAQGAVISRDGRLVAFIADRDGQPDVWLTQLGSGQFHNLTRGSAPELVNPSVRTLQFSPDASFVAFWVGKPNATSGEISIWAAPTLGGEPRPFLHGVAECQWSPDASRLVYHTPGPGDPLFVSDTTQPTSAPPIFTAPAGLHSHFPTWALDSAFIYFVQGMLPDQLDIWRIPVAGGTPQRITSHNTRVTHPVLLNRRTLLYLASDPDGSGPWLYAMDPEHHIPHRLSSGLDRYTSLSSSADGHRLVATRASPKRTLWRVPLTDSGSGTVTPARISLNSNGGFVPRFGPEYVVYVSANDSNLSLWKLVEDKVTEIWSGQDAQALGGPAISPDGRQIAFSVSQREKTLLYIMQSDGTNARVVSDSLRLHGAPAWAPDSNSITSAAGDLDSPHLLRIPVTPGSAPVPFLHDYSTDPAWAPDGSFLIYSGPDIGTTFPLKAITPQAAPHSLPNLTLTRGSRHVAFLPGGHSFVFLKGGIGHKDLWRIDLDTGAQRQLTRFTPDFDIRDFDISPDGRQAILERFQDRSDVVLLDLPKP